MQEQSTFSLHIDPSSEQQEQSQDHQLTLSHILHLSNNYEFPITQFGELGLHVPEDLVKRVLPVGVRYSNIRTVVVRGFNREKADGKDRNDGKQMGEQSICNSLPGQVILKFSNIKTNQSHILQLLHKGPNRPSNIIKHYQTIDSILILECCITDLQVIIQSGQHFNNAFCCKLLADCSRAILYLQKFGVYHRDIKPANVLVRKKRKQPSKDHQDEEEWEFVLADFGSAVVVDKQNKHKYELSQKQQHENEKQTKSSTYPNQQTTYQYSAPQQFIQPCPQQIDLGKQCSWSLGLLLFQCLCSQSLLPLQLDSCQKYRKYLHTYATKQQILHRLNRFSYPTQIGLFKDLLIGLLQWNPEERITVQEVVRILGTQGWGMPT